MKKRLIIFAVILAIIAAIGVAGYRYSRQTRVRMLLSVIHFQEVTLKDPAYLLYEIDIMDLIHNYLNSDVSAKGEAGVPYAKNMPASASMKVEGIRSFEQKKAMMSSEFSLLWLDEGKINMYGQNETVYLEAPMLGEDFAYAFPTGLNLFPKMPDLTSDIDREWFRDNSANIRELTRQIGIEETGNTLVDEDGTVSDEFIVTIPQGCGHFIWELLGMEDPDYDVVVTIYLTKKNHIRRMFIDLSDVLEGATMEIDGEHVGTMTFTYKLPFRESVKMVMTRNPDRFSWIDVNMDYYTNIGKTYTYTAGLNWEIQDNGFLLNVKEASMKCGEETLATGYFKGEVKHLDKSPDVFGDKEEELYDMEELDWREVRDNADAFIQDVINKMSGKETKDNKESE